MISNPSPGDVYLGTQTDNIYYVFRVNNVLASFIRLSSTREPLIDTWDSFSGFEIVEADLTEERARRIMKAIFIAEIRR